MHEKIHVNPRFLTSSQSVSQNVHFNPHFVGQSASRKQKISSACQPGDSDQRTKNVTILPLAFEEQPKIIPSHLPTTPANVMLGRSIARTFNGPHNKASNISNQKVSNLQQHFDVTNNVSTSDSLSNTCCSTSIKHSVGAYRESQYSKSVECSSGTESKYLQQHSTQVNPVTSYSNVSVEAGHLGADSLTHQHLTVNCKTNLLCSYQSEIASVNLLSVSNNSAKMNSAPSTHSTCKSSNVKALASSKVPSTCFINSKFIRKPQLSSASSENLLDSASNKDAPSIHNVCKTAFEQRVSETGQEGDDVNSACAKQSPTIPSGNCNLSEVVAQGAEKNEKVLINNPCTAGVVAINNYNRKINNCQQNNATVDPNGVYTDQRKNATFDKNSVFLNPQFLKHAKTRPNQKVLAKTSFINQSPQAALSEIVVQTDSIISKLVPALVPAKSVPIIKSQTFRRSSAVLKTASQQIDSSELTGLVKINVIAPPSVSNIHKESLSTSNLTNAFNKNANSFAGNWRCSGSTVVYANRNTLIQCTKYATSNQRLIKPPALIDRPNKEINKELRPIMISTKNKLIRRRSSSSSSGALNKQPSAACSKINLSPKNKYCPTISPKLRAQKYSFISRSKLVKCATNTLIRRKLSPVRSQWGYRSVNKILAYSKPSMELLGPGSRKVVPKIVSYYSRRSNGIKKSDHFVRIGESMYKSTATTLKRQLPARTISTKASLSSTSSPILPGRRWHSGTSWSRCWVTDRKAGSTAVVFPSLNSFRISNTTNYAHQGSRAFNLSARKKQYFAPFSTRQQTTLAQRRFSSAMSITNQPKLSSSKRLVLAAHAEKAQMLQRLIIAAKQRSVYILQRKAARNNIALPLTVKTQPSTSDQKQRSLTQTVLSGGNSSNIDEASGASLGGRTKVPYCRFYHRFGRCHRGTACPFEHNPDRVAICTRFLRGRCHVPKCLFAHTLDKGRMPVCSHFLRDALCTRPQCPYLHVNPNPKAPICEDFLHGHCDKREKCKLQHVLECAEFRETGRCPRAGRCPLPHPTRRLPSSALRQNSSNSKKGRNKTKRRRTVSSGHGVGVLGAPATAKRRRDTKPRKQILARYFRSDATAPSEGSATETSTDVRTTSPGVGSLTVKDQCLAQLKVKKQRIMSLIEKMKSRACNSDLINGTTASSAAGKGNTPVLNSGKYKLVNDEDVVFVQPIMEYSADLSLPSFIPLSLTFSPARSSTSTVTIRPPHMQVHPSLPLGSLASSAPPVRESTITESLPIPSSGRPVQPNKLEVSQPSLASQTVTLPKSASLPLGSLSEVRFLATSVKPLPRHPVKASLIIDLTNAAVDPSNHSDLTSSLSLCDPTNVSYSQQVILNTVASSRLALNSASKIFVSTHEPELLSCSDDSSRTQIPVTLHVTSTMPSSSSTLVDRNLNASLES